MYSIKTTEMAERLGVSDSLIRDWARRYAEFLSPEGAGLADGATRRLNEDDQVVMATVAMLRAEGQSHEQIYEELKLGTRVTDPPEKTDPAEAAFRQTMEIVSGDKYKIALAQIQRLQDEVQRVIEERDAERRKYEEQFREAAQAKAAVEAAKKETEMLERLLKEREEQAQNLRQMIDQAQAERGLKEAELTDLKIKMALFDQANEQLIKQLEEKDKQLQEERNRKRGLFGR